jgi:putative hydrolase of HD superfamily
MEIKRLLETLHLAENLKNNTRHSWTSKGRQKSVAEHSWRLTLWPVLWPTSSLRRT